MSIPPDRCLILDLEVKPPHDSQPEQILMIGALRPDTGAVLEVKKISGRNDWAGAMAALEDMSKDAEFVLGHNLVSLDLPILRERAPHLGLFSLPVQDTLRLSPLAFPQNPYHRLVKNYKLISASLNSPLEDCRATWTLFQDQHQAFSQLHDVSPEERLCCQALTAPTPRTDPGGFLPH